MFISRSNSLENILDPRRHHSSETEGKKLIIILKTFALLKPELFTYEIKKNQPYFFKK